MLDTTFEHWGSSKENLQITEEWFLIMEGGQLTNIGHPTHDATRYHTDCHSRAFFFNFPFSSPVARTLFVCKVCGPEIPSPRFRSLLFFLQGWVSPNALLGSGCQRLPAVGIVRPLGVFPLRGVLAPPALVEVKPTQKGMEGPQRLLPHCQ